MVTVRSTDGAGDGAGDVLESRSDTELLLASRDDPAAFRELYERRAESILAYFYRRTLDPEASADLVAETFAVAWERRARFRDIGRPAGAWLFGIARRELGRYRRRRSVELSAVRRLGMTMPALTSDDFAEIERSVDAASFRQELVDALGHLNARDREAIRLRVTEERTFRDVAQVMGCTEGTARVRVHRALRRLAKQMGEQP